MSAAASGARPLKERQREEREQLILQAAEELFLEHGFYETSIDDIAARVGIAKGTVYLHFPSKEDLALALFERGTRTFADGIDAVLASDAPPRDKLLAILRQVYDGMHTKHAQLLMSVFQNPELRTRLGADRPAKHEFWRALSQRISTIFDDGKAAGDFDRAIPTPVMLSLFMSLLIPIHYANLIARERMTADEVVYHLSRCLFRAIAAPHSGEGNI